MSLLLSLLVEQETGIKIKFMYIITIKLTAIILLIYRAVICQNKFLSRATAIVVIGPRQIGKPTIILLVFFGSDKLYTGNYEVGYRIFKLVKHLL